MDSADVCRLLNITKRTLQSYRDKRILPYTNIGGKFFYRESDVAEYLRSKTVKRR
ncbi:helix-turn-helix domain-containing protein [Alistipes ihumii]|uniref:helix-turn-helix domain-containing protein n=1 Tax=Alistipes ihumii TaxID=1470347 RepID=UPI003AEF3A75